MSETVQIFNFQDDGRIPNHPSLPLLVMRAVLPQGEDASACRARFERNGWGGAWVNGVYDYHHYHSNAHEVLGVVRGSAALQLGGEHGEILQVTAGDVLVLPAGTGHRCRSASADFQVVGAYPPGQHHYDLHKGQPEERPQVIENIQRVPLPPQDPVQGGEGLLLHYWKARP